MRPSRRRRVAAALALAVVGAAWVSCAPPDTGGPCTGSACILPTVFCPADMTLAGAPAAGEAVVYTVSETGGTPPVSTTCLPASGSTFPVGTTTVNCTARDAISRSGVCSFRVTLTSVHLAATHFLAFGDSTTAGENGIDPPPLGSGFSETQPPPPCGTTTLTGVTRSIQYFDPSVSYPQQLLNLLKGSFPGESFVMENEGNPAEDTTDGNTRLGQCFQTGDRPSIMLLLEGVNDLFAAADPVTGENYSPTLAEEQTLVRNLQKDVSLAISNGVSFVFVSTILPIDNCAEDAPFCRGADPSDPSMLTRANGVINTVNAMIKANVTGATIVDGNADFKTSDSTLASLIDSDGLHPTAKGYGVLAKTFMTGITTKIPITSLKRRR